MKNIFAILSPLLLVACVSKEVKKAPKISLDPVVPTEAPANTSADMSASQWNTTKVGMPTVWGSYNTNRSVRVMLIGTGVDYLHPDLAGNIEKKIDPAGNKVGHDVIDHDNLAYDHHGLGTKIAGIIGAAHDTKGINGLLKKVSIIPVRYLNENGATNFQLFLEALEIAIKEKPTVIQMVVPQGFFVNDPKLEANLVKVARERIQKLAELEIPVIIGAGNSMMDLNQHPLISKVFRSQPNVIIVTSIDQNGNKAPLANFSAFYVATAAPGEGILTTAKDGGYETVSGTDFAAAHVTSAVAYALANFQGQLSASDIYQGLMSDDGGDFNMGLATYTLGKNQLNIAKYLNHLSNK